MKYGGARENIIAMPLERVEGERERIKKMTTLELVFKSTNTT